jgi:hypothetical protein
MHAYVCDCICYVFDIVFCVFILDCNVHSTLCVNVLCVRASDSVFMFSNATNLLFCHCRFSSGLGQVGRLRRCRSTLSAFSCFCGLDQDLHNS